VSKKTVSFAVPAKGVRPREAGGTEGSPEGARSPSPNAAADAGSDAWVREQDDLAAEPFRMTSAFGEVGAATFVIDLAAERSLTEVIGLSILAPFALGWFWLLNAIAGRPRF